MATVAPMAARLLLMKSSPGLSGNIAGTINSVDASSSSLSVHDLLSKKNITIQVTSDSQLRKLSPEMAQRIAARLKGSAGGTGAAPSSRSSRHRARAATGW